MTDFCHIPLSHYYAFGEVMREPELCQCFLETVLEIKIRRLVFVEKEHEMSDTWSAHGIRLDVYVEDDANSVYSIEMQNDVETMKRVRYYQGNIDRYLLEKGQHYTMLKQSFIIMGCAAGDHRIPLGQAGGPRDHPPEKDRRKGRCQYVYDL